MDLKAPPVATAVSGGPRSILYPYMLQHGLFPNLLFLKQKGVGYGLDAFRPEPAQLSITSRLDLANKAGVRQVPIYFVWCTIDRAVQPMDKTLQCLETLKTIEGMGEEGRIVVEAVEGGDHAYDEDPGEECEAFREWLGRHLL